MFFQALAHGGAGRWNESAKPGRTASFRVRYRLADFTPTLSAPPQVTPRSSLRGRGWRGACRAGRWAGAWAGRAVVGGGRRGGGCAPGRVVGGANAKGGGGRGADMDKLKKVLSGQDTEDRSGLSEVSARGSWHFLERRPALLQPAAPNSAGTQPQVAARALCGRRGSRTLSNIPSEGLEVLKQDLRNPWRGNVDPRGLLDPRPRLPILAGPARERALWSWARLAAFVEGSTVGSRTSLVCGV